MIPAIYIIGSINIIVIFVCFNAIENSAPATMDGYGAAMVAIASLGLSVVLIVMSVICMIVEVRKRRFIFRAIVALVIAIAPIGVYVAKELPRWTSSEAS